MLKASQVILIALLLAALGLAIFWYKAWKLEFPLSPGSQYKSWYVELSFRFRPDREAREGERPVELGFHVPRGTDKLAVADESFIADDYGIERREKDISGNRSVKMSKREANSTEYVLYRLLLYSVDSPVHSDLRRKNDSPKADTSYSRKNRARLMLAEDHPLFAAIDSLLKEARRRSSDDEGLARQVWRLANLKNDDRIKLVQNELNITHSSPVPSIAVFLLNTSGIPARVVNGLRLAPEQRLADFDRWLEYYHEGRWHTLGWERKGEQGVTTTRPDNLLPWWYGEETLFDREEGIGKLSYTVSVKENLDNSLTRAIWKSGQVSSFLTKFSLYNLPLSTQMAFQVLLLIPIGGLVVAFLRQVIGFKTFGTFMPVLVAISFRETGLLAGLGLYALIIVLGLIVRRYFDSMGLLSVPRLSSVLCIVVMLIALVEMTAYAAGISSVLSIALFPIIIMTMTIERITVMWEEVGAKTAVRTALISFLASSICYGAIYSEKVAHVMFAFPELLLVILALSMILGRYNGYKLTEYLRFRSLQKQIASRQSQTPAE